MSVSPSPVPAEPLDALRLLTVAEASEATGIPERTLRHLIASKSLPVVRLGRSVRLSVRDLNAYIAAHTHPGGAQ